MIPFDKEQQKRVAMVAGMSVFIGFLIGFLVTKTSKDKQISKLEAKIMKLEGWQ